MHRSQSVLVLDANIVIRAVLGQRVRELLLTHAHSVTFFTPDVCIVDAKKYLPIIFEKRQLAVAPALAILNQLENLLQVVDWSIYSEYAVEAKMRMKTRDVQDWPIVATALTLNCPVWTEDQDFFGSGLSVWTTDRIQIFFDKVNA